jgi:hypothetical protein
MQPFPEHAMQIDGSYGGDVGGSVHALPGVPRVDRVWTADAREMWSDALSVDVARAWSALPSAGRAELDVADAIVGWMRAPVESGAPADEVVATWQALHGELLGRRTPRASVAAWRVQALGRRMPGRLAVELLDAALAADPLAVASARVALLHAATPGVPEAALKALVVARAACRNPGPARGWLGAAGIEGVEDPRWRVGLWALRRRVEGALRTAQGGDVRSCLSVSA